MDGVLVLEASDSVNDRIHFTDVGEKFVTQAFSLARHSTSPAMSTISMAAGMMVVVPADSAKGKPEREPDDSAFGSIVQKG